MWRSRGPGLSLVRLGMACIAAGQIACGDDAPRPLGATCGDDSECQSGLCLMGMCLDPSADDDLDGLTNGVEGALGANPLNQDSDYDGAGDALEVSSTIENVDSDDDGRADVLESRLHDADGDCLVDQLDGDDGPASDLSAMRPLVCAQVGVCGAGAPVVSCSAERVAVCAYAEIPGWEADESTCDGLDNDCDGRVDEGSGDADGDDIADCVDDDRDNDSVVTAADNCPEAVNPGQEDADGDGLGDACDAPGAVVISGFSPASPGASATPTVSGTAEALLMIELSADARCESSLGSGQADAAGRFSAELAVAENATTYLHVRAVNRAGLASECRPTFATYVHDGVAPAPLALASPPASPTTDARALLTLAAPDEDVQVSLYRRSHPAELVPMAGEHCSGEALQWSLTAGEVRVVAVDLEPNRVNELYALTEDRAGNASPCTALTSVTHDDVAPPWPTLSAATEARLAAPQSGEPVFEATGCAEAETRVGVFADATCTTPLFEVEAAGEVAECAEGLGWMVQVAVSPDTSTSLWMRATDAAGNRGECLPLGSFTHDGQAPAVPVVSAITATDWGTAENSFAVEGAAEALGEVVLGTAADCANAGTSARAVADVGGRWVTTLAAASATPVLYGKVVDRAGNGSSCVALGTLVGEVSVRLVTRGAPRAGDAVSFNAPDGSLLATVTSDADGIAKAGIVAGCTLTAVTRTSPNGFYGWTSVLGLEPGQALTLEVDDGSLPPDVGGGGYLLGVSVPSAPAGTRAYRILSACGIDYQPIDGTPGTALETSFDPACTAEGDFTLVVEALGEDDVQLAFLAAMHLPFPTDDGSRVTLTGPWRGDFASLTLEIDAGAEGGPFEVSYRLGHKSEVLIDFWNQGDTGFAPPGAATSVSERFANIEHAHVGYRVAARHLGAGGGRGDRSYTALGVYVPGAERVGLTDDFLPRVWEASLSQEGAGGRAASWTTEASLAAASDAVVSDLYLSATSSVSWRLIGRPTASAGFALPQAEKLAGADVLTAGGFASLERVEWIDWATVGGFGSWVTACSGVDLATCVRGLAETVTRTSGIGRGGEGG